MKSAAIYPGTFDPLTLGHLDVIRRALKIVDTLVVAVAASPHKSSWFSLRERADLIRGATKGLKGVRVMTFDGLLVHFARAQKIRVLLRGLRAFSDFEYEFQMALSNRKLAPDMETLFLMTSEAYSYISSSTVREVALLGGDTSGFLTPNVQRAVESKLRSGSRQQGG